MTATPIPPSPGGRVIVALTGPAAIAARLGGLQEAVCRLQQRGVLRRLDLDEAEIRQRLWRGHLEFVGVGASAAKDQNRMKG